ncbi:hypothetical protein, partial [Acidisphaera sp. L21]|uniref:hypothetical protein n=1 Tax=Acidisphaera sp. L21 TaxID=1641851 RepID=UPI00131DC343
QLPAIVIEALQSLPVDGSWAPAAGAHSVIINDLLDEGSMLVEEEELSGDDYLRPWRVRLTDAGIACIS